MIRAMIFDLDGTLVQTERLKALSYARAAIELCPDEVSEATVVEAFKAVVGRSRREVATTLVEQFNLAPKAKERQAEFGVTTPWQAFVQVRLRYYEEMVADPAVLRRHRWPHNFALLSEARRAKCLVALATMSRREQVQRILRILELSDAFHFVATRDDVEQGKPDPEIYQLVAGQLAVAPAECVVIEDSPSGVKAALAAGMWCIAVTTPFTQHAIHEARLLPTRWVVDEPDTLPAVARDLLAERRARRD